MITRLYNINSKNYKSINSVNSLSSGLWTFPNLNFQDDDIISAYISILHAEIPNSFYIINENNNKLIIDGITYTLVLGNYNVKTFIDMVTILLPIGYIITYSTTTNKFTFEYTTIFTISKNSTCKNLIGLVDDISGTVPNSFKVTMPNSFNFLPTAKINIRSSSFNINNFGADNSTDIFLTVQNNGLQSGRILYQNYSNLKYRLEQYNLQQFDIRFTDDSNNLLVFNGVDWFITFQIDLEYKPKEKLLSFNQIVNQNKK
jgi:hypothetical protein